MTGGAPVAHGRWRKGGARFGSFEKKAASRSAWIRAESAGECISARGPKDTFNGSAQDESPCEVDIGEGRVDGRVEGRTGVHVESEGVLLCEGNNNQGSCDMLCQM